MIEIKPMQSYHWDEVKKIYEEGIAARNATFETSAPSWEDWDIAHLKKGRLIAEESNQIVGWAALTPVSDRCVYAGVAEISVYVSERFRGKKIGTLLLQKLINESESLGLWTLQAGIFPENIASIKIHEANGFRLIGKREKIGQMDGIWRDTMLFERRSRAVGL